MRELSAKLTEGVAGRQSRPVLKSLSDFGRVTDPATGRVVTGEVVGIKVPNDPTGLIDVTLIAAEVS